MPHPHTKIMVKEHVEIKKLSPFPWSVQSERTTFIVECTCGTCFSEDPDEDNPLGEILKWER